MLAFLSTGSPSILHHITITSIAKNLQILQNVNLPILRIAAQVAEDVRELEAAKHLVAERKHKAHPSFLRALSLEGNIRKRLGLLGRKREHPKTSRTTKMETDENKSRESAKVRCA